MFSDKQNTLYQGIPSLEETEETGNLDHANGLQKLRQFL